VLGFAIALGVVALVVGAMLGFRFGIRRATPPPLAVIEAAERPRLVAHLPALSSLVVEALDGGVLVVDSEERVVLVNPAARAMDIVKVDQVAFEPLSEVARRARDSGRKVTDAVDLPIGRLGREPIGIAVTAVPIRDGESDDSVALLLTDISEQRRLDAVRRDFVANVSHELKTPVGALTLLAEAVQDAAGNPEAVARFAGRMQHEGARLTRLVRELMELSRVQGVDPMPDATEVDVASLVSDAADRERLAAEKASIVIDVQCERGLVVRGNAAQLATAVTNLVDNAVAYSGENTRISVTARSSTDHQARPIVDISVTDQGLGITEVEQDRIFERFYRVDPARSRATGGTGLGLAIVKNIVTNHLGRVSVRSTVGEGSTFTIRLPRVHSAGRSSASEPSDGAVRSSTSKENG
jgi:two-component system sensor histidine kinase SenX3